MLRRKTKLILDLKAEIQHLREALARVIGERDSYREIAREAIQVAQEKQLPAQPSCDDGLCLLKCCPRCGPNMIRDGIAHESPRSRLWQRCEICKAPTLGAFCSPECSAIHATRNAIDKGLFPPDFKASEYLPDYAAPEAKNCPECSVSVRSDSWPQECPACGCTFGFKEG